LHLENWDKEAEVEEHQQRLEKVVTEVLPKLQEDCYLHFMRTADNGMVTAAMGVMIFLGPNSGPGIRPDERSEVIDRRAPQENRTRAPGLVGRVLL
jgi:hypothetical protein